MTPCLKLSIAAMLLQGCRVLWDFFEDEGETRRRWMRYVFNMALFFVLALLTAEQL